MEMSPIVDGLEVEFEGQVEVIRLNAAEPANAQLAAQYGLRGHPAFAVIDEKGNIAGRFLGPQPADILREAMGSVKREEPFAFYG